MASSSHLPQQAPVRASRARLACLIGALGAVLGAGGCGSGGQVTKPALRRQGAVTRPRPGSPVHKVGFHLSLRDPSYPVVGVNQARALTESAAGQTVPLWHGTATALGSTYSYTIVGQDPFVRQANAGATIGVDIVPVKVEFLSSSKQVVETFDPTAVNADCGLTASPAQLVTGSPVFQPADYRPGGTEVGTGQYLDAYMREEFASQVLGPNAPNPSYGVTLNPAIRPEVTVTVPFGEWMVIRIGACGGRPGGDLGLIGLAGWDSYVQQTLIPQLQRMGDTAPTDMLDLLFANVILCTTGDMSACAHGKDDAVGYHAGLATQAGVQYYDTAMYNSTGVGPSDIAPMTHELGEWLNDPDGDNATPPWGNIGQVSGCQSNLEVGDPLNTSYLTVTMPNGVTYHPQELAFLSWFYRQAPSSSVNGWYSSHNTFPSAPPVCSGPASAELPPTLPSHARPFGP